MIAEVVMENMGSIKELFTTTMNELPEKLREIGNNIVQGLIDGIKERVENLRQTVGEIAGLVTSVFRKDMEIKSPSKVTFRIGEYIGEGLSLGIKSQVAHIGNATRLASDIVSENITGMNTRRDAYNYNSNSQTFSPTINVQGGMNTLDYRREANRLMRQQAAMIARG